MTPDYRETRARRRRRQWLSSAFVASAASGCEPDEADLSLLPGEVRHEARSIAAEAMRLYDAGRPAQAVELARKRFYDLEQRIPAAWTPPRETPDWELVNAIREGH